MQLALFLHAYQPPTQYPRVTKRITEESYRPIIDILRRTPSAKATMNFTGSLIEQLIANKESSLINDISSLVAEGRLELVATAAYHPLLTKLPPDQVKRQIELNDMINKNSS